MKRNLWKALISLALAAALITVSGCSLSQESSRGSRVRSESSHSRSRSDDDENNDDDENIDENNEDDFLNNDDYDDDSETMYVTGVKEKLAMRESDDEDSAIILKLKLREEVEVLDDSSETCYYVSAFGKQGYVKKEYLTDEKMAACKRQDAYIEKKTSLYDTAESDHNEVVSLAKNAAVFIVAKPSGDYWYVYAKGPKVFGYVNSMNISMSKVQDASSAVQSSKPVQPAQPVQPSAPAQTGYYTGYGAAPSNYTLYYAKVNSGYLAIRSAKAFDASNELGKMYTGDSIYVIDTSTGTYWYCYSPTNGIYGYVDSRYMVSSYPGSTTTAPKPTQKSYTVWTVRVNTGYLALRTAPAFDSSNEIGQLYTGDVVYVYSDSYVNFTDTYWYVYSPSLGKSGYVNSNYIYS